MSGNNDHKRKNLLGCFNQNYRKLIATALSRQTNTNIPQQINFTGRLKKDNGVTVYFILDFSLDLPKKSG